MFVRQAGLAYSPLSQSSPPFCSILLPLLRMVLPGGCSGIQFNSIPKVRYVVVKTKQQVWWIEDEDDDEELTNDPIWPWCSSSNSMWGLGGETVSLPPRKRRDKVNTARQARIVWGWETDFQWGINLFDRKAILETSSSGWLDAMPKKRRRNFWTGRKHGIFSPCCPRAKRASEPILGKQSVVNSNSLI